MARCYARYAGTKAARKRIARGAKGNDVIVSTSGEISNVEKMKERR